MSDGVSVTDGVNVRDGVRVKVDVDVTVMVGVWVGGFGVAEMDPVKMEVKSLLMISSL